MRVFYQIPNNDLRESQRVSKEAEDAGFDGVDALENAHGPFPPLTVAALATKGGVDALKQYPAPESRWWSTTDGSFPMQKPPTLPRVAAQEDAMMSTSFMSI